MDLFWYSYIFIIGSIIGSFLNVCIYRIPKKEDFVFGRSYCPNCHHTLSFLEMIPIFSYLFLKGKCRVCKSRISIRYPLVELLTGCLFVCSVYIKGYTIHSFLLCIFFCILIIIAGIDIQTLTIPNLLSFIILGLGIIQLFFFPDFLWESVLGFFILSVPMLLITMFFGGFGGGDIKLCAVCGFYLGWSLTLFGFAVACICASIFGIFLIMKKSASRKTEIFFGPFLAIGFILSALFGSELITLYTKLFL